MVRHAGTGRKLRSTTQCFDGAQIAGIKLIAPDYVAKDFADGRGERGQLRLNRRREIAVASRSRVLLPRWRRSSIVVKGQHDE